jgi:glycosyltransferase involved in cell wall biosynthesis
VKSFKDKLKMNKNNTIIGVYVDFQTTSLQLHNVLYHLHLNAAEVKNATLLLLLDQPNEQLKQTIQQLLYSVIELTAQQSGHVYYFNQLIAQQADYYVFITCEMLLAPHSLKLLLLEFTQNESTGLVGPSSNNAWNQQSLYQDESPSNINLLLRSQKLQYKFRPNSNTESLHPLLESCFVLNKALVNTIGCADEDFKNGFCWEIDYQQRAIEAGYDATWVKSAYAHKSYFTENMHRDKTFVTNSRLLSMKMDKYSTKVKDYYLPPEKLNREEKPLISCIMPTRGRANFVKQAITYFSRQDYPHTELIIVYDTLTDLPKGIEQFSNIYYIKSPENSSIGYKRNMAVKLACGQIMVHWDDDDWYANNRLSEQAKPILQGEADITALYNTVFFSPSRWEAWETSSDLYNDMFVKGVHGGTLMYTRKCLGHSQFLDISLREDAVLLEELINKKARLAKIDGCSLFIYLRHDTNSWSFESGQFKDKNGWRKTDVSSLLASDLTFYRQYYEVAQEETIALPPTKHLFGDQSSLPKVSCIMPTKNRKQFVVQAIQHFLKQSYDKKELIIVDDGNDPVDKLIPSNINNIKYLKLNSHHSIGNKRNIANELASGDIIIHWDDDDWMAKDWIATQVHALLSSKGDITGITNVYYFDPEKRLAWLYSYPQSERNWVLGGSLCYWKKFWTNNQFKHQTIGEDAEFLWTKNTKKIIPHQEYSGYIGFVHGDNTSPKDTSSHYWTKVDPQHIQTLMSNDESI